MESFAYGRYSKRKRAQVNYDYIPDLAEFESDTGGSPKIKTAHVDDNDQDVNAEDSAKESESDYEETQLAKSKNNLGKKGKQPKKAINARKLGITAHQQPFEFLELPAELRNAIYEHVLFDHKISVYGIIKRGHRYVTMCQSDSIAEPDSNEELDSAKEPGSIVDSAILAVNKQIYFEARPVLYSNDFHFSDLNSILHFAARINPNSLHEIRIVSIKLQCLWFGNWSTPAHFGCFVVLAQMSNLSTLNVTLGGTGTFYPREIAIEFFRIAFPFLYAVASRQGNPHAGIDILEIHVKPDRSELTENEIDQVVPRFKDELRTLLDKERVSQQAEREKKQKQTEKQRKSDKERRSTGDGNRFCW